MSTAFVARFAPSVVHEESDNLRRHLESCLADFWADLPAPVWVADVHGEILYVNRMAQTSWNGAGQRQAAARIAEVLGDKGASSAAASSPDGRPVIEVSPLLDGCGQRVGWLAIGTAAR